MDAKWTGKSMGPMIIYEGFSKGEQERVLNKLGWGSCHRLDWFGSSFCFDYW